MNKSIFILPHQDDEVGIFKVIDECKNNEAIFFYLTTGAFSDKKNNRRYEETVKVLGKLNIPRRNIFFIGHKLKIQDQKLHKNLFRVFEYIKKFLSKKKLKINNIYSTTWEGGHTDHDSCFLIALALNKYFKKSNFYSFPIYSSMEREFFFSIFSSNKLFMEKKIQLNSFDKLKFLLLMLNYKSQFKSFIILFPVIFFYYLFHGNQKIFILKKKFNFKKPHTGKLFYEKRFKINYEEFSFYTKNFFTKKIT